MAGKRKAYTPEFKLQAVTMVSEQKLSVAEVARRLGVTENLLHSWKKGKRPANHVRATTTAELGGRG
ncbi:Mobile element protein [Frigoriglobus tundricola]|uniref:Mobile element protein n=1 Tax=Frigoriglobus tundricola TaxID=2774151 RepID=A0A6M5YMI5_9BACT|nr:transposase [Frigoriglobus tundricola]QJW94804.1 Mobile element protein [Frigoriglobus tundricola]